MENKKTSPDFDEHDFTKMFNNVDKVNTIPSLSIDNPTDFTGFFNNADKLEPLPKDEELL